MSQLADAALGVGDAVHDAALLAGEQVAADLLGVAQVAQFLLLGAEPADPAPQFGDLLLTAGAGLVEAAGTP